MYVLWVLFNGCAVGKKSIIIITCSHEDFSLTADALNVEGSTTAISHERLCIIVIFLLLITIAFLQELFTIAKRSLVNSMCSHRCTYSMYWPLFIYFFGFECVQTHKILKAHIHLMIYTPPQSVQAL